MDLASLKMIRYDIILKLYIDTLRNWLDFKNTFRKKYNKTKTTGKTKIRRFRLLTMDKNYY